MNEERIDNGEGQATPNPTGQTGSADQSATNNYQWVSDTATKQVNEAADALRKGEFIRNAVVDPDADSDDRLVGLLSYVIPVLLPIIVLLSESSKKRPFQRYHAAQSLGLTGLLLLLMVATSIITGILTAIPIIGFLVGVLMICISPLLFLMTVAAIFFYGYQAYQGRRFAIPIVTSFLHDQGWL